MALENNPTQNQPKLAWPRLRIGNGTKNASDEEIEDWVGVYEAFELAFAGVVVIGVAFEFFLAILHPAFDSPRGYWGPFIGDAFVAIGLVVEVAAGARAKSLQDVLTRRSNERLSEAVQRAAQARERAAKAELALEEYKAPWSLLRERNSLKNALSAYGGQQYHLHSYFHAESREMAQQLDSVLRLAGWLNRTENVPMLAGFRGIRVGIRDNSDEIVLRAAAALLTALADAGVDVLELPQRAAEWPGILANTITIDIGTKR